MSDRSRVRVRGVKAPVDLIANAEGIGEGISIGMTSTPEGPQLLMVLSTLDGPALATTLDFNRFLALTERLHEVSSRMESFVLPQHEPEVRRP